MTKKEKKNDTFISLSFAVLQFKVVYSRKSDSVKFLNLSSKNSHQEADPAPGAQELRGQSGNWI